MALWKNVSEGVNKDIEKSEKEALEAEIAQLKDKARQAAAESNQAKLKLSGELDSKDKELRGALKRLAERDAEVERLKERLHGAEAAHAAERPAGLKRQGSKNIAKSAASITDCGPAKVVFSPAFGCTTLKLLLGEGPSTEVPRDSAPPAAQVPHTHLARIGARNASGGASGTSTPRLEGADDSGADSSGAAAARGKAGPFFPEADRQARRSWGAPTTLMLRNVPETWSRDMLTCLLDSRGFSGQYDFVYLAMKIKTQLNVSYAFLNFISPGAAGHFVDLFHGLHAGSPEGALQVCFSEVQGLDANVRRHQNSPIMSQSVPDVYKPALFCGGRRIPFPAPTTTLRGIRLRNSIPGVGRKPDGQRVRR